MKKYAVELLGLLALVVTGCSKEGTGFFRGTYGYTISGTLECRYDVEPDSGEGTQTSTGNFQLVDEQGIMHIEPHGDATVMTMKDYSGSVQVYDVEIDGKDITVKPHERKVKLIVTDDIRVVDEETGISLPECVTVDVTVSGHGYKTGELMVLELEYGGGTFEAGPALSRTTYTIAGSSVSCVATRE